MESLLNQVFHTKDQQSFLWGKADSVPAEGGYITNINGKIVAFVNKKRVRVPKVLFNEAGIPYFYVANLYKFARRMAKKHGVYKSSKNAPIRVYYVKTEEEIKSIVNGVIEAAGLVVDENSVLVQNVIGGEFYVQTKEYLAKNYALVSHEGMFDLYEYAGDVQDWTFCDVNIFAAMYGDAVQFLATPMLRFDNPKDVYGCNYVRFWGDDQKAGTHRVLGFFRACGTQFFATPFALAVGIREATFEPPKCLLHQKAV